MWLITWMKYKYNKCHKWSTDVKHILISATFYTEVDNGARLPCYFNNKRNKTGSESEQLRRLRVLLWADVHLSVLVWGSPTPSVHPAASPNFTDYPLSLDRLPHRLHRWDLSALARHLSVTALWIVTCVLMLSDPHMNPTWRRSADSRYNSRGGPKAGTCSALKKHRGFLILWFPPFPL